LNPARLIAERENADIHNDPQPATIRAGMLESWQLMAER
jgi:hypothetical protein